MNPNRATVANGRVVEEYYWAGKYVVYVDNKKVNMTFEEACDANE